MNRRDVLICIVMTLLFSLAAFRFITVEKTWAVVWDGEMRSNKAKLFYTQQEAIYFMEHIDKNLHPRMLK